MMPMPLSKLTNLLTRAFRLTRKSCSVLVQSLLLLCLAPLSAWAQVPHDMAYQGRITDAVGAPLSGSVNLQFRIFEAPAGGFALYVEDHTAVALDSNGAFSIRLGAGVAIVGSFDPALFSGINRYLEVVVDGEALSPRQPLGSVPWALVAEVAEEAVGIQGAPNLIVEFSTIQQQAGDALQAITDEASRRIGNSKALFGSDKRHYVK